MTLTADDASTIMTPLSHATWLSLGFEWDPQQGQATALLTTGGGEALRLSERQLEHLASTAAREAVRRASAFAAERKFSTLDPTKFGCVAVLPEHAPQRPDCSWFLLPGQDPDSFGAPYLWWDNNRQSWQLGLRHVTEALPRYGFAWSDRDRMQSALLAMAEQDMLITEYALTYPDRAAQSRADYDYEQTRRRVAGELSRTKVNMAKAARALRSLAHPGETRHYRVILGRLPLGVPGEQRAQAHPALVAVFPSTYTRGIAEPLLAADGLTLVEGEVEQSRIMHGVYTTATTLTDDQRLVLLRSGADFAATLRQEGGLLV